MTTSINTNTAVRLTTIAAALRAAREGLVNTARGSIDENIVVFATCPFKSGHVFYTCRVYGTVYAGFLAPEDNFQIMKVRPRTWTSPGSDWAHTNWASCEDDASHEAYHFNLLEKVKDKQSYFCPGRLRKFRKEA